MAKCKALTGLAVKGLRHLTQNATENQVGLSIQFNIITITFSLSGTFSVLSVH